MTPLHVLLYPILYILMVFFLATIPIFMFIRKVIQLQLTRKYGVKFKGFLEGVDVMFALGDDKARGIINVLAYIEISKTFFEPSSSSAFILANLRSRLYFALMSGEKKLPALFYKRRYELGYYFWVDEDAGPIEKYVRSWDFNTEEVFITESQLKKKIAEKSNSELPDGNTRNWELLVSNKPLELEHSVRIPVGKPPQNFWKEIA